MHVRSRCWLLVLVILDCSLLSHTSAPSKELIAEVESGLMKLFGFKGRPKIDKSKIVVPPQMIELYEKQTGLRFDTTAIPKKGTHTKSANTVRSFLHSESSVDAKFTGHHKFRFKFDVSSIPKGEKLQAAELALNREIVNWLAEEGREHEHFQRIIARDIVRPGIRGKSGPITRVIDSQLVDTRKNSVLNLDVAPAVQRWLEDPKSNHGILVHISGKGQNASTPARHIRLRRSAEEDEATWQAMQPLLLTYTDDGRSRTRSKREMAQMRPRRATKGGSKRRKLKNEPCKRNEMFVSFRDVGWDNWIVAPNGYDAYYCKGDCTFPLSEHHNTTNHAIVQTLMNSVSPRTVPKACCVPTELNAISMLYLDTDNKVVLKNYGDMVVLGCGCR